MGSRIGPGEWAWACRAEFRSTPGPSGGWIRALGRRGPAPAHGVGTQDGGERFLPGELELGRRAGRSRDRCVGGEAEVFEDPADDLAVGDERCGACACRRYPRAGGDVDLEDALEGARPSWRASWRDLAAGHGWRGSGTDPGGWSAARPARSSPDPLRNDPPDRFDALRAPGLTDSAAGASTP